MLIFIEVKSFAKYQPIIKLTKKCYFIDPIGVGSFVPDADEFSSRSFTIPLLFYIGNLASNVSHPAAVQ
jgi:hypothetical protein